MESKKEKSKKRKDEKPVTVHITNHNKFEKGVGAFITNLNHLTIVMDGEGNMKLDASQVPGVTGAVNHEQPAEPVAVSPEEDEEEPHTEDLVSKLKPIFFNNEDDVRQFLKEIDGMKDKDKTDLVNRWVKDKRISDYGNSRKGVLWDILHKAGLYKKSKQNWNRRVS